MALNTSQLEQDIKNGVSNVPLDGSVVVSDEIAKVVANAVRDYLTHFVSSYTYHTHSGVITAVTGGSGAPAEGIPGSTSTTTNTI